jgi:Rap1a immunity proteins
MRKKNSSYRSRRATMAASIVLAAMFGVLTVTPTAHAESGEANATMFYASCMAAADIVEGRPSPSDQDLAANPLVKATMCFGAVTALVNLEPFFKPEFGMCPPEGGRVSYAQAVLVIAAYLRNHPEKLHENFHSLAAVALHLAWPCRTFP